ncbi:uncharacterized protein METZ01_LOCUS92531 [marine metagenome]|uniref:TauD/TfdA-like domain-containing protein n=1 Tax=marine metagenome TaxID=408172 RepID=A0A381VJ45_9ZZZZ
MYHGEFFSTEKHILDDEGYIQLVSHDGLFERDEVPWHNDWSYGVGQYNGTALYNFFGGHLTPTWFIDMKKAYDELPDKEKYENVIGTYFPPENLQDKCFTERQLRYLRKNKTQRPFIIEHPITKDKMLYFSPGSLIETNVAVDIEELTKHCEQFEYPIHWKDNEILLYDNLRMMHRRDAFEGERILWRIQFNYEKTYSIR